MFSTAAVATATPEPSDCASEPGLRYRPLGARSFRLLALEPLTGELGELGTVRCRLFDASLDSGWDYTALSYAWGPGTETERILINGVWHSVRRNLYDALRLFSRETPNTSLWCDALCINQDDLDERGTQVGIMQDIYSRSKQVVAWLGQGTPHNAMAIDFIKEMVRAISNEPSSGIKPYFSEAWFDRWRELGYFYANQYWLRVWVIQELVCAPTITIRWGNESISWQGVALLTNELTSKKEGIKAFNHFSRTMSHSSPGESTIAMPFHEMVAGSKQLRSIEWCRQRFTEKGPIDLEELIYASALSAATREHDHIYALLGLSGEQTRKEIPVDYRRPITDLFISVSQRIFLRNGNLAASPRWLSFSRGNLSDALPSWVPDYTVSCRHHHLDYSEMFAGIQSDDFDPSIAGTVRVSGDGRQIHVDGVEVDAVAARKRPSNHKSPGLVGYLNVVSPNLWMRAAQRASTGHLGPEVQRLLELPRRSPLEDQLLLSQLHREHFDLQMGYAFETTQDRLGWSATEFCAGDKICILQGSALPYMLRKRSDGIYVMLGEW